MTKIAINRCFGGFGLSDEGMKHYAKLKGLELYPEDSGHGLLTYWTLPKDKRPKMLVDDEWLTASQEERVASNKAHSGCSLYDKDIERDDHFLVQTIADLGEKANGHCANLEIVEVPDGVKWQVEEYDGNEHIAESHRTW